MIDVKHIMLVMKGSKYMCGVLLNGGSNKCIYVTVSLPLSKEVFINSSGLVLFFHFAKIFMADQNNVARQRSMELAV